MTQQKQLNKLESIIHNAKKTLSAIKFENGRTYKDLHKLSRRHTIFAYIVLFLTILVAFYSHLNATFAIAKSGQIAVLIDEKGIFHKIKLSPYLKANLQYTKNFLAHFINDLDGANPEMVKSHLRSINKMTDRFRELFLRNRSVSQFIKQREDSFEGNFTKSSLKFIGYEVVEADYKLGGRVVVRGAAILTYDLYPKSIAIDHAPSHEYIFFESQLMVTPMFEDYFEGFKVDHYIKIPFSTRKELEAYLIENNIHLRGQSWKNK